MRRARMSIARSLCSSRSVSQGQVSWRRRSNRFRLFSCNGALLRSRGVSVLALKCSEAAEESVYDGTRVEHVFQSAEGCGSLCRANLPRLCRRGKICRVHRDLRFTAIGQDQNEMQSTFAMNRSQNVERPAFEWMASTDDGDSLRKVLMMGSVSWLPSTGSSTTN